MFILDEEFHGFRDPEETVLSVFQSINEPKIAAAERTVEPAQAFIVIRRDSIEFTIHVVLHLKGSNSLVAYTWDEGPFSRGQQAEMEGEALDFVEGMGFMMDNLNVEKLPSNQKKALFAEIPVFQAWPTEAPKVGNRALEEESEKPTRAEARAVSPHVRNDEIVPELESLLASSSPGEEPGAPAKVRRVPVSKPVLAGDVELGDEAFQRDETDFKEDLESIGKLLDVPEEDSSVPAGVEDGGVSHLVEKPVAALLRWFASF